MNRLRTFLLPAATAAAIAINAASAVAAPPNRYQQTNLVSDGTIAAAFTDPNLVNAWGVAFNPFGFVWVADNGTGRSTLYDGSGKPQSLVVRIPSGDNVYDPPGTPTGIVYNGSNTDFTITVGAAKGPARFIFVTEDGIVAGWAPAVNGTDALFRLQTPGAVYKGVAIAGNGSGNFLYAADFFNGRIDVFDSSFNPIDTTGRFVDPALPPNFAPFNITSIQGDLYVTYAFRKPGDDDETAGPGLGIVDVFNADGQLIRRVATRGKLNAPWGVALAPASFGRFADRLLVGNFGDGTINAYDAHDGSFKGQLRDPSAKPIRIDGLWGLAFGNGVLGQLTSNLYFTAGPVDESRGLYGAITAVPGPGGDDGED